MTFSINANHTWASLQGRESFNTVFIPVKIISLGFLCSWCVSCQSLVNGWSYRLVSFSFSFSQSSLHLSSRSEYLPAIPVSMIVPRFRIAYTIIYVSIIERATTNSPNGNRAYSLDRINISYILLNPSIHPSIIFLQCWRDHAGEDFWRV